MSWSTRLFSVTWRSGNVPLEWQTGVVAHIFRKMVLLTTTPTWRVCSSYLGITLRSFPWESLLLVLERKLQPIVEPQIQEEQYGFHSGCGTTNQLFTIAVWLGCSCEFAPPIYMCFVDLEKADDRVPWRVLWGHCGSMVYQVFCYGLSSPCLTSVRAASVYSALSQACPVGVGLCQCCPLSTILFVIFMDRISRRSRGEESAWFGNLKFALLVFADEMVLLASSVHDFQHSKQSEGAKGLMCTHTLTLTTTGNKICFKVNYITSAGNVIL